MINNKATKEQLYKDKIKAEILDFFQLNEETAWSLNQVNKAFAVRDRKTKDLFGDLMIELHKDKKLIRMSEGHYMIDASTEFLEGRVDHVNVRFGFVVVEGREDDILINAGNMNGAIDGDIVKVLVATKKKKLTDKTEGEVIEILKRGRSEIVGTIEIMPNYAFVVASSKKIYGDIFVSKNDLKNAQHGDKVIVKITKYAEDERKMEGIVIDVLGKSGENNTEMHAILAEFGLPISFPINIEKEAENIPTKITTSEIKKRRDFRKITTFTIDPADAKDFDDALSFEFLENGNYEIGVHIADVTHYVTPESALEQEAFMRATSVYLVDRVVPMLPEKLSNGLCSLRPNEDKLTFSAVFEVTPNAKVVKEWFGRTVIHSDKRFSYEEAQAQLTMNDEQSDDEISQITNHYSKELYTLNQLAHKLRDERFAKGAVNFETVEVKFQLDEDGKPLGVYQKIRVDAHKLIEEFMLLANKKVAEYVFNLKKTEPRNTMVYRVHDAPNPEKLKNFSTFAKRFGYNVDTEVARISQSFNELMHDVEGKAEQNILENLAVRTMSKAKYSTDAIGHFGLAFPFYSHFTSPIRRYPDMMAHRMLQHYLDGGQPLERAPWELRCKHSSEREKMAAEAERASIKYKQVEYMSLMDDDKVWDGIISGVTEFGIFVEITETASEGLIRMVDLKDDFYDYDRDNYRIVGQRNGKVFTFGDKLQVKVKECNLARRSMDLLLVGANGKVQGGGERTSRRDDSSRRNSKDPKGRAKNPRSGDKKKRR